MCTSVRILGMRHYIRGSRLLVRRVVGPKGRWSEGSLVRRVVGPKGRWSEGSLVRKYVKYLVIYCIINLVVYTRFIINNVFLPTSVLDLDFIISQFIKPSKQKLFVIIINILFRLQFLI